MGLLSASSLKDEPLFFLNFENFGEFAKENAEKYKSAEPFPNIVIENFLDADIARAMAKGFPQLQAMRLEQGGRNQHMKGSSSNEVSWNGATRQVALALNSGPFLKALETLTGIDALIPDPSFGGGGLHQIGTGGFLKIHADYNIDKRTWLDRRLNLLLYLNDDWDTTFGGDIELWAQDMSRCVVKVPPRLGTCVIFSTTSSAYHGHPDPMQCPPEVTRKSLALYYYTNGRPEEERYRPEGASGDRSARHTTLYQARPGEALGQRSKKGAGLLSFLKRWSGDRLT